MPAYLLYPQYLKGIEDLTFGTGFAATVTGNLSVLIANCLQAFTLDFLARFTLLGHFLSGYGHNSMVVENRGDTLR